MTAPILYNYDLNEDCYRVRLLASCIGVKLTQVAVDEYPGRGHLSPEMLALNPTGGLPVLVDQDLTMMRPQAILLHLAHAHDTARRFIPDDRVSCNVMMDWLFFAASHLAAPRRARVIALQDDVVNAASDRVAAKRALRLMDDHMQRQTIVGFQFFAGSALTLADLTLFPSFALSRDYGLDHDTFPGLRLWARRVRATPGFITMPGIPDYH